MKLTTALTTPLHSSPIALNFPPSNIHMHTYTFKYFQVLHRQISLLYLQMEEAKKQDPKLMKTFFPSLTQSLFFHFAFPNFCTNWQAKGLKELFSEQLYTESQKSMSFWFLKQRCCKLWCGAWNSERTHWTWHVWYLVLQINHCFLIKEDPASFFNSSWFCKFCLSASNYIFYCP